MGKFTSIGKNVVYIRYSALLLNQAVKIFIITSPVLFIDKEMVVFSMKCLAYFCI